VRSRRWVPWALIAVGIVLFGALAGRSPSGGGRDLDPGSTGAGGTRGLVDSLRALDADVAVDDGAPDARTTAVLVLVDGLRDAQRRAIASWVGRGGTLVVADHDSPLNPFRAQRPTLLGLVERDLPRRCSVPALSAVGRVRVPQAVLLRPRPPAVGCFSTGNGAWLVTQSQGGGNIVVLGGAGPLTNAALGDADNGLLAVTLLAPRPGARVQVVPLPAPGAGRRTLTDLVSPHVKLALLQLGIAFALYALWRARRLGRPVVEPSPVEIPGSELVAAVGRLFQRRRARDRAAALVRDGTRRALAQRLGLAPDAAAADVAEAAARRSGRSVEEVRGVLDGPAPADERQLVVIAQDAEMLSREVTSG
jgi:uncharacterized protein DUF4350